jgi:hypothetical protein
VNGIECEAVIGVDELSEHDEEECEETDVMCDGITLMTVMMMKNWKLIKCLVWVKKSLHDVHNNFEPDVSYGECDKTWYVCPSLEINPFIHTTH